MSGRAGVEALVARMLSALPDEPDRFAAACEEVGDWAPVLAFAGRNGLGALVYEAAVESGAPIGPDLRLATDRRLALASLRQAQLARAAGEASKRLGRAGVQACVLKGPILAERIYPRQHWRHATDVDLLVAERDLEKAGEVLAEGGYLGRSGAGEQAFRRFHHHLHFEHANGVLLELHFRLHSAFEVIPSEPFLARAHVYRTSSGATLGVLAPEDELVYLATHAAGHGFAQLSWLYDLKLFVRRHPGLDWPEVARVARRFGLEPAVVLALDVLEGRLGARVPRAAFQAGGLRIGVARRLAGAAARPKASLRRAVYGAMLCDGPRATARFFARRRLRAAGLFERLTS